VIQCCTKWLCDKIIRAKIAAVYDRACLCRFVIHLFYMLVFTAVTTDANTSVRCNFSFSLLWTVASQRQLAAERQPRFGLAMFVILPVVYLLLELLDLLGTRPYRFQLMTGKGYTSRLLTCIKSEWTITGNRCCFTSKNNCLFTLYFSLAELIVL